MSNHKLPDASLELAGVGQVVDNAEDRKPIIDIEIRVMRCVVSDGVRKKINDALEPFLIEIGDMVQEDLIKSRIVTSE